MVSLDCFELRKVPAFSTAIEADASIAIEDGAAAGGAAATMPAVAWYTSPHAFSFGEFGNSVNAFSVNASGSISAAAASSSGGGGGFSGGGFGGGGGGGW